MKKLTILLCIFLVLALLVGCGTQNEYLAKGKEWVKSDKRGRIPKAVAQFELAIAQEPDNAEAHYMLGYYDENSTIQRRAEQMVLAYKYDKKKYLKVLIEETLRDRNENVRQSAILALQAMHEIDSMIKPLVKMLKSKDSRDRDNAALVLSKLSNHKEIVDRLLQDDILKHKRMSTRFDAIRALGDIGDPRAIDPIMERITVLKTEDEEGEEPEVRRAGVMALRKISKRNIDITSEELLNVTVEPAGEGVRIVENLPENLSKAITIKKDEIISHVIDHKEISSLEDYERLVIESMGDSDEIVFGLPKIVKVSVSNIEELGILGDEMKLASDGSGLSVEKMTIESKAAKMGIEKGEIISYINDKRVNSLDDYNTIIAEALSESKELKFMIANEDKYKQISVPMPEDISELGITVEDLPGEAKGVIVTDLESQSPAVEAGVRMGQTISYVVSKKKVRGIDEYRQMMRDGLEDGKVTISVINKNAIDKLIAILRNKGLSVRFDAAAALGEVKDKAAVESLIEMLQEQANPIEIKL